MTGDDRTILKAGSIAALLGTAAGLAEILAGTVSWAGDKNDPTTLGRVSIGLALVIGAASVLAARSPRPGAQLGAAVALLTGGLIGLTTAGLAWVPAFIASTTTFALVVRRPRGAGTWRAVLRAHWAAVLVGVLALVYLAFGVVAAEGVGLLGIAGAVVACTALALRRRSPSMAAVGLVLAAVPFAAATAWTVVTPLTAVLLLAIGLPDVLVRTHPGPSSGGAS
ncbi:MAG: hypothetical protein MUF83_07680 [Acidimicrobiales bacterium]|jgi:hypothetical protein|nr:hypothetical protein [Acidimicrobiales bacterium]